jgi:hypothetical protein
MKKRTSLAIAAALVLFGTGAASAAVGPRASDTLDLSATQQKTAWNDINKQASNQTAPADFNATPGVVVPSALKISSVPSRAARDVPSLRPYDFAMVQGKLLIVNPSDKKIAEVITG